jgi:hypothetical protein
MGRHLERRAWGRLTAMRAPLSSGDAFEGLEWLGASELGEVLEALGVKRLALALQRTTTHAVAQVCARLGEPAAARLLEACRTARASADAAAAHQAARALLAADGVVALAGAPGQLLPHAGATWLGPTLARSRDGRLRRVAQRLPRSLGERLLAAAVMPITAEDAAAARAAVVAQLRARKDGRAGKTDL